MKYKRYSTAGQVTGLVSEKYKNSKLAKISSEIMKTDSSVEQVGFLYIDTPRLQMMGGELCINGTLAAGADLCQKLNQGSISFFTSGFEKKVTVKEISDRYSLLISSSIVIKLEVEYVELSGIAFFLQKGLRPDKQISRQEKIALESFGQAKGAAGIIFYDGAQIQPLVYVSATNTMYWENACGSGSLAYALASGQRNILQPSGETISITKINDTLTISASVKEIL